MADAPTITVQRVSDIQQNGDRRMVVGVMTLSYAATPEDLARAQSDPQHMHVVTRNGVQYIEETFGFRSGGARMGETLRRPDGNGTERRNDILPGLADDDRTADASMATYSVSNMQDRTGDGAGWGRAGHQWSLSLTSGRGQTNRDGFCIHPDGGGNGTAGCIGIIEENGDADRFKDRIQEIARRNGGRYPGVTVLPANVDPAEAARIARSATGPTPGGPTGPSRRDRYTPESGNQIDRLNDQYDQAAAYYSAHPQDANGANIWTLMLQFLLILVGAESDAAPGQPINVTDQLSGMDFLTNIVLHRATVGKTYDAAALFGQLDTNHDQAVSYGEVMARFDVDHNGRIDGNEVQALDGALGNLQAAGIVLDSDHNGSLSLEELRAGLSQFAQRNANVER